MMFENDVKAKGTKPNRLCGILGKGFENDVKAEGTKLSANTTKLLKCLRMM